MDDSLLAQFQSTFLVHDGVNDPHRTHPHYTLYKSKKEGYGSQEARRKHFLEEQQNRRRNFADHARKLAEGDEISDDSGGEMDEGEGMDEVDVSKATKKKKSDRYPYKKQLMLSEWLVDVPEDFEENWMAVVVPVGRRSLIISARKTTLAYSRSGALLNTFPSHLPGGSKRTHRLFKDYCILDCVFHEATQSYFILDVMCWGGYPVYDSDLEFRTFWKEQKCKEFSQISTYSRINPLPFHNLLYHPCTKENLARVLSEVPSYQVDGLLFVHKKCRYIIGHSPLALWLKPHMVPDILGLPVGADFLAMSPAIGASSSRKGRKMETEEVAESTAIGAASSRKGRKMETEEVAENTAIGASSRKGRKMEIEGVAESKSEDKNDTKMSADGTLTSNSSAASEPLMET